MTKSKAPERIFAWRKEGVRFIDGNREGYAEQNWTGEDISSAIAHTMQAVEYIRADLVDPWNHNMDEAPRDGREFLAFDKNATPQIYVCWRESFDNDYGGYLTDHYDSDNSPTAWKHITPPE